MTAWTDSRTAAHQSLGIALAIVDNLLSFVKDGQGKPSKKERALFAAAVVFTYGIWENFIEQLAIEAVQKVSEKIAPDRVPEEVGVGVNGVAGLESSLGNARVSASRGRQRRKVWNEHSKVRPGQESPHAGWGERPIPADRRRKRPISSHR